MMPYCKGKYAMTIQIFVLILLLTLVTGLADAHGFVYAARMWTPTGVDRAAALVAIASFVAGIPCYLLSIRYLAAGGVQSVELQTACWFIATIIGVAVAGGNFWGWQPIDQSVAIFVILGVLWLVIRTG